MKLFLDSANINDIKECIQKNCIHGITTNPTLISKIFDKKITYKQYMEYLRKIRDLIYLYYEEKELLPISVEILNEDTSKAFIESNNLFKHLEYNKINFKIPLNWNNLVTIKKLVDYGYDINCTCLFDPAQCIIAANAGVKYVSIFTCRLKDAGINPFNVIEKTRNIIDKNNFKTEIISGSIRHKSDVIESISSGAHIVTTNVKILKSMTENYKTIESVNGFIKDIKKVINYE